MKATGIVRRIDDLGRIVIPKEIRRSFRIKEGDPLEIFTDAEGEVIFKKYSPIGELSNFASQYAEVLHKSGGLPIAIMDNDHVVAASGISKREILERRVTKNLEELMENRAIHITNDKIPSVNAIEGYDRKANYLRRRCFGCCLYDGGRKPHASKRIRHKTCSGGGSFFGQTDGIIICAYCTKNNAHFCTICYIGRKYKKGLDF